jgi:putative redox protein
MTPEEMLLAALGSCMAQTTKLYAARKGWPLEAVDVKLEMERFNAGDYADYEGDANFVHEFREDIKFWGPLDKDQLARLYEIATKCPVRRAITTPGFFKDLEPEPAAK